MPLLTIFTPTFNRANLLVRGYEALKRQSSKDFIWLIIDDGSTDDTRDVVKEWCTQEVDFQIRYIYKENGDTKHLLQRGVYSSLPIITVFPSLDGLPFSSRWVNLAGLPQIEQ